jgi:hypothetical protein
MARKTADDKLTSEEKRRDELIVAQTRAGKRVETTMRRLDETTIEVR